MFLSQEGIYEGSLQAGLRLAEVPESEGGWGEYFAETDGADLRIEDPVLRAQTALMLENAKRWLATKCGKRLDESGRLQIDEATRSAVVGGFSDYLFPIIRAGFPTNPVNDLVSVQPTTRRTASVVYFNWVVGSDKGSYAQGQKLFDANTGSQDAGYNFSNEVIDAELTGALGGNGDTYTGTLAFNDGGGIRPGSVQLSIAATGGTAVLSDDGQGGFLASSGPVTTLSASSINYSTGAFSVTNNTGSVDFLAAGSAANSATYRWDSEGSSSVPQIDVQITTSTVETERRALKMSYSIEAMQDIMSEFGVSLEPNLVSGAAEQMNHEIARQVIAEIWDSAPYAATFKTTVPTGLTRADYFQDLVYALNIASNNIESRTQKGYGNWLVVDDLAANVIETLPSSMFVAAPRPASVMGLHMIGTLAGKYRVYKDIKMNGLPGANVSQVSSGAVTGNILMGFKGSQFYEAGFVWSPYNLLYTTPSLTTANFMTEKGMASRYATKLVNPDMYARIQLNTA
jgi:hypothetical protein